jgi:formate dehydrogenase maturation protein FdhE
MHIRTTNASEANAGGAAQEISQPVGRRDRDTPPVCSDKPMEARLAHAHDWQGERLFVAVCSATSAGGSLGE